MSSRGSNFLRPGMQFQSRGSDQTHLIISVERSVSYPVNLKFSVLISSGQFQQHATRWGDDDVYDTMYWIQVV